MFFYELKMEKQTKQKQSKAKSTTTKQTSKENQTLTRISNDLTMRNLSQKQFRFFI